MSKELDKILVEFKITDKKPKRKGQQAKLTREKEKKYLSQLKQNLNRISKLRRVVDKLFEKYDIQLRREFHVRVDTADFRYIIKKLAIVVGENRVMEQYIPAQNTEQARIKHSRRPEKEIKIKIDGVLEIEINEDLHGFGMDKMRVNILEFHYHDTWDNICAYFYENNGKLVSVKLENKKSRIEWDILEKHTEQGLGCYDAHFLINLLAKVYVSQITVLALAQTLISLFDLLLVDKKLLPIKLGRLAIETRRQLRLFYKHSKKEFFSFEKNDRMKERKDIMRLTLESDC